ncbi:MAG: Maf family protein [Omnitrophica bacterium]|nr:Maf family protein [Candidatus Omnitrophota bacterium]
MLASRSRARRSLLKQAGFKFRVAVSRKKEKRKYSKENLSRFVIENALEKCRDVADRYESGIVIAADTVVLAGKQLITKPRNVKDAQRTLKLISRAPQWVYTGLAVIDIDNNKVYTVSEKTKIYMHRLSDKTIKAYFKKVSPLDKAGSFDIQGPGAMFINRVEGCFYNVVGLPMAKLARILERIGVDIFTR